MDAFFFVVLKTTLGFGAVMLLIAGPFAAIKLLLDIRGKKIIRERFSEAGLDVLKVTANRSSFGVWFKHGTEVHHIGCQLAKGHFRWVGKAKPEAKVLVSALNNASTGAMGSSSQPRDA
jgi:hypothetical protein